MNSQRQPQQPGSPLQRSDMQCTLTRALPAVSSRQSAHAQSSSQVVRALGSRRAARLAPAAAAAAASNGAAAACNGSASLSGNGSSAAAGGTPTAAETARTIVDLVAHGTLCTLGEDGVPLGTYASYVLDAAGQPILRLRADAVHTANLKRDAKCSLFVQPGERPASLLARVTLIGAVEPISEGECAGGRGQAGLLIAGVLCTQQQRAEGRHNGWQGRCGRWSGPAQAMMFRDLPARDPATQHGLLPTACRDGCQGG